MPGDGGYITAMPRELIWTSTFRTLSTAIPYGDCRTPGAGDQRLARVPRDGLNLAGESADLALFANRDPPQMQAPILGGCGQPVAVVAPGELELTALPLQEAAVALGIDQRDPAVVADGQGRAVRGVGEVGHGTGEIIQTLCGGQIIRPQGDGTLAGGRDLPAWTPSDLVDPAIARLPVGQLGPVDPTEPDASVLTDGSEVGAVRTHRQTQVAPGMTRRMAWLRSIGRGNQQRSINRHGDDATIAPGQGLDRVGQLSTPAG